MRFFIFSLAVICSLTVLPALAIAQEGEDTAQAVGEVDMSLQVPASTAGTDEEPVSMDNTSAMCTTPPVEDLKVEDKRWVYCDIYARQFAYRTTQFELREKLVQRAINYNEIQKAARDRHAEALKAHHAAIGQEGTQQDKGSDPFH